VDLPVPPVDPGLDPDLDSPSGTPAIPDVSRRDTLITEATGLFAARGYGAVGVDEIAEAVGMAGPSIYSHFASKQEILVASIQRGAALLSRDSEEALGIDSGPEHKLGLLVDSYVRLANRDRFVIRVLLSEMSQLPPSDREEARLYQRRYIDTWVELLAQFTGVDATAGRIRVQAVLLVVNDAVQTPHLRAVPGFEHTLRLIAGALLGLSH
jgi:AcrR family transcriptional regulator